MVSSPSHSDKIHGPVKSRHTREDGYPWTIQLLDKNGFPIKAFGNDSLEKTFYETIKIHLPFCFSVKPSLVLLPSTSVLKYSGKPVSNVSRLPLTGCMKEIDLA